MFKKISEENIRLTAEVASECIKINTLDFQRPIRARHVKELVAEINKGHFLTADIAIGVLDYNGHQRVLLNGQHCCTAVIQSGKPVDAWLSEYKIHSLTELSLIYRLFDNHASRSMGDVIRPEMAALGIKWSVRVAALVVAGAATLEGVAAASKQEKIELLKKHKAAGDWIASVITTQTRDAASHMRRATVVAAMITTWLKNRDDANLFWLSVKDGENLKKKEPAYKLREYLLRVVITGGNMSLTNSRSSVSKHEMFAKCIHAWNAYRRNIPTDLKYRPDKPVPKAI